MEIIIADANVFVYFFLSDLLKKVMSHPALQIKITSEVYNELTNKNRRITKEYPELKKFIEEAIHNSSSAFNIACININTELENIVALQIFYELEDSGLDLGERESIPLAFELKGVFISNDQDAIDAAQRISVSLAQHFLGFCQHLVTLIIITQAEFDQIRNLLDPQK